MIATEILQQVEEDTPIFVTRYGKPIAVIRGLAKDDLEGFALLTDAKLRRGLEEAPADMTAGRVSSLDELIADLDF